MTLERITDEERELLAKAKDLPDKLKADVWQRVQRKTGPDRQVWYCRRGRTCDGRPHEGVPYGHARSDQWPPEGIDWDVWFFMSGRGSGKRLALDTPLPTLYADPMMNTKERVGTPTGWTTMGEIKIGDTILDENGRPTRVLDVTEPALSNAYRIYFSDGTSIDACEDHLWVTHTLLERKQINRNHGRGEQETPYPEDWAAKSPITTSQMFSTQKHGKAGYRNHSIPLTAPLDLPDASLLVEPWLLGYWLGNGSTTAGTITTHPDDQEWVRMEVVKSGHLCGIDYARNSDRAPSFAVLGLVPKLRAIGVLGDKRIPGAYMRASRSQREALFAGILDSDGYIDEKKQSIEITVVHNEWFAQQIVELARSLGQKPVMKSSNAGYGGKITGIRYRITFRPTYQPFRNPRRVSVWRPPAGQGSRSFQRMVVSVEKIEPQMMRCITVDSPNSMYLAGEGMIPTHNTKAGGHWSRMMSRKAPRIALIGRRGKDVRQTMVEGPAGLIKACEAAGESYDWKPSVMEFTFENGGKALGYSGEEPESLRGPEHSAGWLDEPCHIDLIEEVWSNYNLGLRSAGVPGGAKTLLTSSPLPTAWTKERIAEKGQIVTDEFGEPVIDEETGDPERAPLTVLVQVSTSVNLHNLDAGYRRRVINPLRGTRKGKQELEAVLLEDVEGALWEPDWLQRKQFKRADMDRVVVSVDPAGSNAKTADLTGLIVAGRDGGEYGIFEDATGSFTPNGWALKAIALYEKYQADAIVLERYGGDTATTILRNAGFKGRIIEVKARVGKAVRAEPITGLYEQKLVWHLERADLADLEDQMLTWVPGVTKKSPDRIDACLVGNTPVETIDGWVRLDEITEGTLVRTRAGWKPVLATRLTHRASEVMTIELEDGRAITGTGDHRILSNGKWVRMDALAWGDTVDAWSNQLPLSTTGSHTAAIQREASAHIASTTLPRAAAAGRSISIEPSTPTRLGQSQMGITSTIRMGTRSTISRRTSKPSPQPSTRQNMRQNSARRDASGWTLFAHSRLLGTALRRAANSMRNWAGAAGRAGSAITPSCAIPVAPNSPRSLPEIGVRVGSVRRPARAGLLIISADTTSELRAPSVAQSSGKASTAHGQQPVAARVARSYVETERQDVYDIMVAEQHEFSANGIVVHNCVWALTELSKRGGPAGSLGIPRSAPNPVASGSRSIFSTKRNGLRR